MQFSFYRIIHKGLKSNIFQSISLLLITASITSIIFTSFEEYRSYKGYFYTVSYFSSFFFFAEYVLRIIAAPELYKGKSIIRSRFKYIFSFFGIVDFSAMLPFLFNYIYWDSDVAHLLILPHVFTFFKLIRYSKAFQLIGAVLKESRSQLVTVYTACAIVICIAAILMYNIECHAQPEAFSNIGDSLWWAIITFTTVGYGDIYPITPIGKLLSGMISLVGIGMIALPTAIISSSYMNIIQRQKEGHEDGAKQKYEESK